MNVNQLYKALGVSHDYILHAARKHGFVSLAAEDRDAFVALGNTISVLMQMLKDAVHINLGDVDTEDLLSVAKIQYDTVAEEIRNGTLKALEPCYRQMPFPSVLYSCDFHMEETIPNLKMIKHHMLVTDPDVALKMFPHLQEGIPEEVTALGPCIFFFIVNDANGDPSSPFNASRFPALPLSTVGMLTKKGEEFDMCLGALNRDIQMTQRIIDDESPKHFISAMILTFFLKLLTCKNVELRDTTPAKYKSKPKEKRPIGETWEIVLRLPGKKIIYTGKNQDKPVTEIKFVERQSFGTISQRRGHLKTYTSENPLFGKHVGTWYWLPCFNTRVKNYRVERTDK